MAVCKLRNSGKYVASLRNPVNGKVSFYELGESEYRSLENLLDKKMELGREYALNAQMYLSISKSLGIKTDDVITK